MDNASADSQHLSVSEVEQYARGELDAEAKSNVEQHLASCSECQRALEQTRAGEQLAAEIQEVARQRTVGLETETALTAEDLGRWIPLGPPRSDDYVGTFGTYDVVRVVGRGGMGVVLKCYEQALNRVVAVKVLRPDLSADASAVKRFQSEARSAAQLNHPNIVTIHATGLVGSTPYIAMQYVKGLTLSEVIQNEGALDLKRIVRIASQMAAALAHAHSNGFVHRDIKPSNVILENDIERVILTDFGLARALADATRLTLSGTVLGTPRYMSPEQARGESVDARSDIFSLGAVLYEMCTGKTPFKADSAAAVIHLILTTDPKPIREISPDVPEWLGRAVERSMAKDPNQRYQTARELDADLLAQQAPRDEGVLARRSLWTRVTETVIGDRSRAVWLAAIVAVVAAAIGLWALLPGAGADRQEMPPRVRHRGQRVGSHVPEPSQTLRKAPTDREAEVAKPLPPDGDSAETTTPATQATRASVSKSKRLVWREIFKDDFERYPAGVYPGKRWRTLCRGHSAQVTTEWPGDGTKSLCMQSPSNWGRLDCVLLDEVPDRFRYEVTVMLGNSNSVPRVGFFFVDPRFPNQNPLVNGLAFRRGPANDVKVFWEGPSMEKIVTVATGQQLRLIVDIDFHKRTATVRINEFNYPKDLPAWPKVIPEWVQFKARVELKQWGIGENNFTGPGLSKTYFDDIVLCAGDIVKGR